MSHETQPLNPQEIEPTPDAENALTTQEEAREAEAIDLEGIPKYEPLPDMNENPEQAKAMVKEKRHLRLLEDVDIILKALPETAFHGNKKAIQHLVGAAWQLAEVSDYAALYKSTGADEADKAKLWIEPLTNALHELNYLPEKMR